MQFIFLAGSWMSIRLSESCQKRPKIHQITSENTYSGNYETGHQSYSPESPNCSFLNDHSMTETQGKFSEKPSSRRKQKSMEFKLTSHKRLRVRSMKRKPRHLFRLSVLQVPHEQCMAEVQPFLYEKNKFQKRCKWDVFQFKTKIKMFPGKIQNNTTLLFLIIPIILVLSEHCILAFLQVFFEKSHFNERRVKNRKPN